jgi:hypothetical protein
MHINIISNLTCVVPPREARDFIIIYLRCSYIWPVTEYYENAQKTMKKANNLINHIFYIVIFK